MYVYVYVQNTLPSLILNVRLYVCVLYVRNTLPSLILNVRTYVYVRNTYTTVTNS